MCAFPTLAPTAEPTRRAVLTAAAATPVAACLPDSDDRSPSYEVSRVRRLGEFYTACIRAEMDVESSPAHAATRVLSDRVYRVLVEIGEEVMTGGVRSLADAARLAALVKYHSDVLDFPPADRGDAILQALVNGIIALGERGQP